MVENILVTTGHVFAEKKLHAVHRLQPCSHRGAIDLTTKWNGLLGSAMDDDDHENLSASPARYPYCHSV